MRSLTAWLAVQGGKLDDITVLVAVVVEEEVPLEQAPEDSSDASTGDAVPIAT